MNVRERMLLATETSMSLSTVYKWDKGGKVYDSTAASLEKAAEKLGLLDKREATKKAEECD